MLRADYYGLLMRNGFEPFHNSLSDWRRAGIEGEVDRVWVSDVDRSFRAYAHSGLISKGHGTAPWELEALL